MMCKWLKDEICVNSDCPAVADFCPLVNHPGVCRYEEMDENKGVVRNDTLSVKEWQHGCSKVYRGTQQDV